MARVNNIVKTLAAKGLKANRVSQSTLILQQPITAGATTYNFPCLQNEAPVLPEETRLALQDMFFVTAIGVCFSAVVTNGVVANARDLFFSPPVQSSALAIPLLNLYRGRLSYQMDNVTYLSNWDLDRHYAKGQAQLLGVAGVNGIAHSMDERYGSTSGIFPVDPGLVINGNSKVNFTINLINNALAPVAAIPFLTGQAEPLTINFDRICLVVRGFLGQNSSNVG